MQRLYSLFPHGLPGLGLIGLRLAVALSLREHDPAAYWPDAASALHWLAAAIGLGLIGGVLTPWLSLLSVASICVGWCLGAWAWSPGALALALAGLALSLLGPGAYSLDAHLFGRRVLRLPERRP